MPPGLRRKEKDAPVPFFSCLKFSVLVVQVLRFSSYCAIYKINRGFEVFEVFRFNRTGNAFVMFFSQGDSDTVILLEGTPKQGGHRGSCHHPSKAGGILVRIYFQVRAKVLCPIFLHASGV
jgi:hypothetical protein